MLKDAKDMCQRYHVRVKISNGEIVHYAIGQFKGHLPSQYRWTIPQDFPCFGVTYALV